MQFEERSRRLQFCRLNHQRFSFISPLYNDITFLSTVTDHGFTAPETLMLTHSVISFVTERASKRWFLEFSNLFPFPYCIVIIIAQRRKFWYLQREHRRIASLAASSSKHVNWTLVGGGIRRNWDIWDILLRHTGAHFLTVRVIQKIRISRYSRHKDTTYLTNYLTHESPMILIGYNKIAARPLGWMGLGLAYDHEDLGQACWID